MNHKKIRIGGGGGLEGGIEGEGAGGGLRGLGGLRGRGEVIKSAYQTVSCQGNPG